MKINKIEVSIGEVYAVAPGFGCGSGWAMSVWMSATVGGVRVDVRCPDAPDWTGFGGREIPAECRNAGIKALTAVAFGHRKTIEIAGVQHLDAR